MKWPKERCLFIQPRVDNLSHHKMKWTNLSRTCFLGCTSCAVRLPMLISFVALCSLFDSAVSNICCSHLTANFFSCRERILFRFYSTCNLEVSFSWHSVHVHALCDDSNIRWQPSNVPLWNGWCNFIGKSLFYIVWIFPLVFTSDALPWDKSVYFFPVQFVKNTHLFRNTLTFPKSFVGKQRPRMLIFLLTK